MTTRRPTSQGQGRRYASRNVGVGIMIYSVLMSLVIYFKLRVITFISRHALYKSLLSLDVLLPEKLICNE